MLQSLRHYDNAKEYIQKALVISTEIGDRKGEADDYGCLGAVFRSLGQYEKAKENLQKAPSLSELKSVIRKGKQQILQTLELCLELLEIMKLRKYA